MRTLPLAAFALVLPLAGLAGAGHGCNGTVTALDTPAGLLYLDDRSAFPPGGPGDVVNHWLYLESNGVPGLQSGGQSIVLGPLDADPCAHANPDTLLV